MAMTNNAPCTKTKEQAEMQYLRGTKSELEPSLWAKKFSTCKANLDVSSPGSSSIGVEERLCGVLAEHNPCTYRAM